MIQTECHGKIDKGITIVEQPCHVPRYKRVSHMSGRCAPQLADQMRILLKPTMQGGFAGNCETYIFASALIEWEIARFP